MTTEGEERLIKAVGLLVIRYTTTNLPEAQRHRAPTMDDGTIRELILAALNLIVTDLTEDIMAEVRRTLPTNTLLPDGRTTVLDNKLACTVDGCGLVSYCAAVIRLAGEVVHVECEQHAPEFK